MARHPVKRSRPILISAVEAVRNNNAFFTSKIAEMVFHDRSILTPALGGRLHALPRHYSAPDFDRFGSKFIGGDHLLQIFGQQFTPAVLKELFKGLVTDLHAMLRTQDKDRDRAILQKLGKENMQIFLRKREILASRGKK